MSELKVFRCTDTDWFAAFDATHASDLLFDLTGAHVETSCGYPEQMTDAQLDEPLPEFNEDEQRTGKMTSMRQMLAEHGDEPGWLAGTE